MNSKDLHVPTMSEPQTPSGRALREHLNRAAADDNQPYIFSGDITAIEAEARDAVLDALEEAVEALPTIYFTPEQDPGAGDVVYRAAVLEAIQQQRRQP